MDLKDFHGRLLGMERRLTPQAFWRTEAHDALYEAYASNGTCGYAQNKESEEHFLATVVMALAFTEQVIPTYIFVPVKRVAWVTDQFEIVARHVFRCRRNDQSGVAPLRQAFRLLRIVSKFTLPEPPRWVVFGFTGEDALPPWAAGKLLQT